MQNQIYFIDSKLNDYQTIVNSLSSTDIYYLIDSSSDGLIQMSEILSNYSNLDSIHVYSHGDIGSLNIGNTIYDNTNISNYKIELENIGKSLSSTGDILLYGCNVGQDEVGQKFINQIAEFSQADVAASNDLTGNRLLGGDWDLEVVSGNVETEVNKVDEYESTFNIMAATPITNGKTIKFDGTAVDNYYSFTMKEAGNVLLTVSNIYGDTTDFHIYDAELNFVGRYFGDNSTTKYLSKKGTYYINVDNPKGGLFSIYSDKIDSTSIKSTSIINNQTIKFDGTAVDNYYSFTMKEAGNVLLTVSNIYGDTTDFHIYDAELNFVGRYFGDNSTTKYLSKKGTYYINVDNPKGGLFSIYSDKINSNAPTSANKTITINEDISRKLTLSDFIFKDADADSSLSKIKITALETKGTLKLSGKDVTLGQEISAANIKAGNLVYTPNPNEFGTTYANFKFQVSDGTKYSTSSYTTTFNVTQVIDTFSKTTSYTLPSLIENLTLTGSSNINGTGNSLNNKIVGNSAANKLTGGAGNDILDGKAGIDTMIGGTGNDTYYVDNTKDVVTELASQGTDLVNSSITYTLGANVENLTLTGTAAINGTGNTLNNVISGNTGNNVLNGGAGNDTLKGGLGNDILYGGTGKDTFVFNTKLNASINKDTIKDFNVADDTISLENAIFKKLTTTGLLNTAYFKTTTDGKATDSNDYIVYNKTNGQLLYDADGNGAGASVLFAVVENKANLTNADFTVI